MKPWSEVEDKARGMLDWWSWEVPDLDIFRAAIAEIDRLNDIVGRLRPSEWWRIRAEQDGEKINAWHRAVYGDGKVLPSAAQVEAFSFIRAAQAAQRAVNQANSAAADAIDPPSVKKPSLGQDHPIDDGHLEGPTLTLQGAIGRGDQARRFRTIATLLLGTTWPSALERWSSIIDVIGMKQEARESFSVSVAVTALGNVVVTFHAIETPAAASTSLDNEVDGTYRAANPPGATLPWTIQNRLYTLMLDNRPFMSVGFDSRRQHYVLRYLRSAIPCLERIDTLEGAIAKAEQYARAIRPTGATATWPVTTHVIREPLDVHRAPTGQEKGD